MTKGIKGRKINIPNLLTFFRILLIPFIVFAFYSPSARYPWIAAALFAVAAITDYFDGYLARLWGQTSRLGRILDPIADKLLVTSVLLILAYNQRLGDWGLIPAIIILCREVLVSGLREFMAEIRVGMPVTRLAKWKTAAQLAALPCLIIGGTPPAAAWNLLGIGEVMLWVSAILTIITGYDYLRKSLQYIDD
ncbi:CDP-diacylglycerol--glycerol-3-phosphate 3-phosphatidyltransferase [Alphaproteobacteria bacterium]|nr:CDP-diacylglycerol--glycerol-3-phosphate 3-phosphatidyltransferase [Alphaproteobacteria bacterium]